MRRFGILLIFVMMVCFARTSEARKLALLVGVDEYANVPSLKCCVNDMNTLKEALKQIGFKEEDIQILVTGGESDPPTKKNIEQKISEILSRAKPKDMIFFAFSGHGVQEEKTVYFCPPDVKLKDIEGTCVSITKVMDDLEECQAKFKWVVVDACRSDANSRDVRGFQVVPTPPSGIALFQSCAKGERSYEEERAGGNGYFTKNFAAALSGKADANHDGDLTLMEVCTWTTAQTKDEVKNAENKIQTPYFSGSFSDFVLKNDPNVPIANDYAKEAKKAYEARNYLLAMRKYDAALALCPQFEEWKNKRDEAKKSIWSNPTSRDSFEWDGTIITKFVGSETDVIIPEGATEIGYGAFADCSSLKSVIIPEGVTEIGEVVFFGCSSLTSVVIPDSVGEIRGGMFAGCTSLKEWSISSTHPYFKRDGVALLTKDGKKMVACPAAAEEYRIPGGVTKIGGLAFWRCSSLTSVVIPEGVTEIGDGAFASCSSLTSVVIPEGVTEIGEGAFGGCMALTSVEIPESVTEIGEGAFLGCSSLTSVVIPDSVEKIGPGAFGGCTSLKEWSISSSHPYFKRDGVGLLTKDGKTLVACLGSAKEYLIPEGVTEIGPGAFAFCSSLTSVVIPEGVTEIGQVAFSGCSSLTSVVIPEGVTEIGDCAFLGCSSLTSVVIPESVTWIGEMAFGGCPKLTIHAPAGSKAEEYAKKKGIPFQAR